MTSYVARLVDPEVVVVLAVIASTLYDKTDLNVTEYQLRFS